MTLEFLSFIREAVVLLILHGNLALLGILFYLYQVANEGNEDNRGTGFMVVWLLAVCLSLAIMKIGFYLSWRLFLSHLLTVAIPLYVILFSLAYLGRKRRRGRLPRPAENDAVPLIPNDAHSLRKPSFKGGQPDKAPPDDFRRKL
jgi:hypothetical protein